VATDERWFYCELERKLDELLDAMQDAGPFIGLVGEWVQQQEALLLVSVLSREAAVCISTRPASLST
jgi:hypothetical protein